MNCVYLREVDVCLTCDVLCEFTGEHPTITTVHLLGYVLKQKMHIENKHRFDKWRKQNLENMKVTSSQGFLICSSPHKPLTDFARETKVESD